MGAQLSEEAVLALAPCHLPNRSHRRYQGQKERVTLEAFAQDDRALLLQAYGTLLELFNQFKPLHGDVAACRKILGAYIVTPEYRGLATTISHLGHATSAMPSNNQDVDRLVHDLRGGAFQALIFRLQLFEMAPARTSMSGIYFLLRDHLKIMRNCVADLDPPRFEKDCAPKAHDVKLLLEKWSEPEFSGAGRPVDIELSCHYSGTLCESCMEFSSLDRIIYNVMNNAARFTADKVVSFAIAAVPTAEPTAVRFVVTNTVTAKQRDQLVSALGDNPSELFRGGFTTGGHGVGARICADVCAHAFGIPDFDEALNAGYFGARWMDDRLAVWFHWPAVGHPYPNDGR